MAHNLEFKNGKASLVLAEKPAWHDHGVVLENAFSWDECIRQNQSLNYEVEKRQLLTQLPDGSYQFVDSWGVFRKDNNYFLGAVGSVYETIQISYAFKMCDTLLEAENGAHYESAGVLGKGERFFVTARINRDFEVTEGDVHETYLLFSSSHDGSLKTTGKITTTRVVCQNTLTAALLNHGAFFGVKHTANSEYRLEQARKLMTGVAQNIATIEEKFKMLAQRKIEKRTIVSSLNAIFGADIEGETSTRKKNIIMEVLDLYADNDGNAFPEQKGTAFNLLNAITNHTDHFRGVRQTKGRDNQTEQQLRSDSAIFGEGDKFKTKALDLILKQTKDCPVIRPTLYSIPTMQQKAAVKQVIEHTPTSLLDDILETSEAIL